MVLIVCFFSVFSHRSVESGSRIFFKIQLRLCSLPGVHIILSKHKKRLLTPYFLQLKAQMSFNFRYFWSEYDISYACFFKIYKLFTSFCTISRFYKSAKTIGGGKKLCHFWFIFLRSIQQYKKILLFN